MANDELFRMKLKLIIVLFKPLIADTDNQLIDDKLYYIELYNGMDNVVKEYLNNIYKLTKRDLIYINKIVKRLTDILSLDESLITKEYIATKLCRHKYNKEKCPFDATDDWIDAYKKLIKYIKNDG